METPNYNVFRIGIISFIIVTILFGALLLYTDIANNLLLMILMIVIHAFTIVLIFKPIIDLLIDTDVDTKE